jgi:hypothetical protein
MRTSGVRIAGSQDRRKRVLRAGSLQILRALLLAYCILLGIAFLFGPSVGYEISFSVCLGTAGLVTAAFGVIFLLDRTSSMITRAWSGMLERRGRRKR